MSDTKNKILFPNGQVIAAQTYIKTAPNTFEPWDGSVTVSVTSSGSAIEDGVDDTIKATVIDGIGGTGVANPLAVTLTDSDGNFLAGSAVSIADGADVAEGAIADVAVTGDNSGTVSAKLRGINKILANVWDSINSRLNVFIQNTTLAVTQSGSWVLSAGSAIIGNVRIDQTTPGTTNGVVVNSSALPSGAATLAEQQTQTASLSVLDDWDETDRAKVNPIVGQAGVAAGAGAVGVTVQRTTLASDDPAVAVLGAITGAAVITDADGTIQRYLRGLIKLAITAGSFLVTATIAAGTALIGKVSASDETSVIYEGTTALTPKFAIIQEASSGNNAVVAAVASKKIRVLSYNFISNGTVNVKFQSDGAGTPVDLTGLKYCVANMGISVGYSKVGHFESAAGKSLDINLSDAIAVGGELTYIEVS